ncbi:hypothetical protein [Nocardia salmonicida]|uniref:hypothetical protein n=1 Tax=Nocardia salmonicida TaxID=53431 RepID=UPI003CF560D2
MIESQQAPPDGNSTPDIGFALRSGPGRSKVGSPTTEAVHSVPELTRRLADGIAEAGPDGWRRFDAVFALTVVGGVAFVLYYDEADRPARVDPAVAVLELAEKLRAISAEHNDGPWWRMVVRADVTGGHEVEYDYGHEPFPEDQILVPEAYLIDLQTFPRAHVPVWLAAYVFHNNWQSRSPKNAATAADADRDAGRYGVPAPDEFPALPLIWARWATIAATFVAVGSERGPRILPALGLFEGSGHSGSTLHVLPGDRAVLSGGVWNSPELDAAYNDDAPFPDLYAGAPDWVVNQVLNPRVGGGLMSFCYWWDHDGWYRGDSPTADHLSAAVPGVWSTQDVADILCDVAISDPNPRQRQAALDLVAAAESGTVTRDIVAAFFEDPSHDVAGALVELSMAGLVTSSNRVPAR